MADRFELARASELQPHLAKSDQRSVKLRRAALRKVVSNMIVNNPEMLSLYPEILHCLESNDSEIKRMCFLYLETYVKSRPQQLPKTLQRLVDEASSEHLTSGIRAVALRTLSSIPAKSFAERTIEIAPFALKSQDPYLRKTACFAVAKAWATARLEVEKSGILGKLNQLLIRETSPVVVAAAVQSLLLITDQSLEMDFVIDYPTANRLASFLDDSPEFSQISLLSAIMKFTPSTAEQAEHLAHTIIPSLRHTNAAVTVGAARALMMLSHYSKQLSETATQQVFGPLLSQLNRPPEIQYSVLRNIQLLLQGADESTLKSLKIPPQTFFCKSSDVPYIRATKIDILSVLCTPANADMVVKELIEFTRIQEDSAAQRRAITALAKLATKYDIIAPKCVQVLKATVRRLLGDDARDTLGNTETEEVALTQLVLLIRRYPENRELLDDAIETLMEVNKLPSNEEAQCVFLWLVGTFAASPSKVVAILGELAAHVAKEKSPVQLALLTATVKAHFRFPNETRNLVPKVLQTAANTSVDPDVRDRALLYSRLLSRDFQAAQNIISTPLPSITENEAPYDHSQVEDLELSLGYLSSIYLKPSEKLFRVAHSRQLQASPALLPRKLKPVNTKGGSAPTQSSTSVHTSRANPPLRQSSGPPPPPTPRPLNYRQSSLMDQFQGMHIETPPPEDLSIRLIDI